MKKKEVVTQLPFLLDPEFSGFVAAGRNHTPFITANKCRFPFEGGVVEDLDGDEEGVEVEMGDMVKGDHYLANLEWLWGIRTQTTGWSFEISPILGMPKLNHKLGVVQNIIYIYFEFPKPINSASILCKTSV